MRGTENWVAVLEKSAKELSEFRGGERGGRNQIGEGERR